MNTVYSKLWLHHGTKTKTKKIQLQLTAPLSWPLMHRLRFCVFFFPFLFIFSPFFGGLLGNNAVDENGLTRAKANVVDEALASLQPALCDKDGAWTADYVRLRFKAHLPYDCAGGTALDTAGNGGGGGGSIAKRDRLV